MGTTTRQRRLFAGLAVATMLFAACGSDEDGSADTGAATTVAPAETTTDNAAETTEGATETTVAETDDTTADTTGGSDTTAAGDGGSGLTATAPGCEEQGVTDQVDISPGRPPARCEPGFPEPQPLAEPTTLTVSSAFSLEFMSPILLAKSLGEFEKENLDIEIVSVSFADAVPQLAQGSIDAAVGGIELALFNAGNQGLGVKAVMGNYFPPNAGEYDEPQTGLWCRRESFTTPDDPDLAEIQNLRWASSVGKGSISVYYSATELANRVPGFDVTNVQVDQIPSAETVTALQNGAIDCGILLDPLWLQVAEDPAFFLAATQTPGEPLGQVAFGKNLLVDNREAGEAFVRAIIRTINTYYDGDYHSDAEVMAEIAEQTGVDIERMTQVPSLVMDWELREGTTERVQELFISLGVITEFSEPVPEEEIIDRSFYLAAVGAE